MGEVRREGRSEKGEGEKRRRKVVKLGPDAA